MPLLPRFDYFLSYSYWPEILYIVLNGVIRCQFQTSSFKNKLENREKVGN